MFALLSAAYQSRRRSPRWYVSGLWQTWTFCTQTEYDDNSVLVVHPKWEGSEQLEEALRLASTFSGVQCPHIEIGTPKKPKINPATYFGLGQVEMVKQHCDTLGIDKIFANVQLSGTQQRNFEQILNREVVDRVGLIIGIFNNRAMTNEAKLQVELAQNAYRASRLVRGIDPLSGRRTGFGEGGAFAVVSARRRGGGGGAGRSSSSGGGGEGETELELQRRRIKASTQSLEKKLKQIQQVRQTQREGRKKRGAIVVAVVGYTNAGKSSLVSKLTNKRILAEDKLFATLDTTMGRVMLPSGNEVLLCDTVGFISNLPTELFAAFRSTLEEVVHADVIVHLIDASSERAVSQRKVVHQVLADLGISKEEIMVRQIEVWNKMDNLIGGKSKLEGDQVAVEQAQDIQKISVKKNFGIEALLKSIDQKVVQVLEWKKQQESKHAEYDLQDYIEDESDEEDAQEEQYENDEDEVDNYPKQKKKR